MKIEKRIYRGFSKGIQYAVPICVIVEIPSREKVLIRRKKK